MRGVKQLTYWGATLGNKRCCLTWDGAPLTGKRGIIHLESAAGDWMTNISMDPNNYTWQLAMAGFVVCSTKLGANTWCNTAVINDIAAFRAALNFLGIQQKYLILGRSMGGANGAVYAATNPTHVAGLITDSGALDLSFARGTDGVQGSFYASINTANTTGTDALWNAAKAAHDPLTMAASVPNVPMLHGAFTTETVGIGGYAVTLTNFYNALTAGAKANTTLVQAGGSGHTGSLSNAAILALANACVYT